MVLFHNSLHTSIWAILPIIDTLQFRQTFLFVFLPLDSDSFFWAILDIVKFTFFEKIYVLWEFSLTIEILFVFAGLFFDVGGKVEELVISEGF